MCLRVAPEREGPIPLGTRGVIIAADVATYADTEAQKNALNLIQTEPLDITRKEVAYPFVEGCCESSIQHRIE
jgi:hypothetical protein